MGLYFLDFNFIFIKTYMYIYTYISSCDMLIANVLLISIHKVRERQHERGERYRHAYT